MRNLRVFVSSPGDVQVERDRAHEILTALQQEPAWQGKIGIEVVRWDNPQSPTPMYANFPPQEAVNRNLPKPSECDLVVLILWGRFGTPLVEPLKADGSCYLSGTEWEYEDALNGKVPILLHRRMSDPQVSLRDPEYEEKRRQLELVDSFFKRFASSDGGATGGYIQYRDVADFQDKFWGIVQAAIRQLLEQHESLPEKNLGADASPPRMSFLTIVDRLTRQLEEKDKEIDRLRNETLILKRTSSQRLEVSPIDGAHDHVPALERTSAGEIQVATVDLQERQALSRDPSVAAIAPVFPMVLMAPLSDSDTAEVVDGPAWGIAAIGADRSPFTGNDVVVAIIDTGIDIHHPAFAGLTIVERDFTGDGNGDRQGHGTHFAGTVFGRAVNGRRIGVAPGVSRALIGKVFGSRGATSSGLLQGLNWAVEEGADVIAMSLRLDHIAAKRHWREIGATPEMSEVQAAAASRANVRLFEAFFTMVQARGSIEKRSITIVAAAGNESQRNMGSNFVVGVNAPADIHGVVSVASLGKTSGGLRISPFSNAGADLAAPGERIVSARIGGGLVTLSGTGMAAAHVAGVAALWAEKLALDRSKKSHLGVYILESAAYDILKKGFDPFDVGRGVVRAPEA